MRWGGEKEEKKKKKSTLNLYCLRGKKQTASDVCCPSEMARNAGLKDA